MDAAIIGGGSWGTAFCSLLAYKGKEVLLWTFEPELSRILEETRENVRYLPGFILPENVRFTNDLDLAAASSDNIILATPSFALRSIITRISHHLSGKRILILTKGLETESLLTMSQVAREILGKNSNIAVLSGPSFAREVVQHLFTSVVVASSDATTSRYFQNLSHDDRFRVYRSDDIIGVELGGALKNVMAIGAGIIEGLGLGSNTLAAYLTRALAEIKRLGRKLGARETTFMGLSGMGDLILTCTGPLSRNRAFGIELAKGKQPSDILRSHDVVVEGYYTIGAAFRFARSLQIEMPITEELYRVVYEGKDIKTSFEEIRKREIKEEED
jgi:glycerol-3-phosphate dehydrogenase (NAD(P)+)